MIIAFCEDSGKPYQMQNLLRQIRLPALILILATTTLPGCSSLRFPGVYRIDIGQGNLITKEMIEKLKLGMSPRQVEYVMGSPMIADTFHPDRWDYMYSLETGTGILVKNQITLYFDSERLAKIDDSLYKDPDKLRNDLLEQMGLPIPPGDDKAESAPAEPASEEPPVIES
ncbi:MAG: outer membrane protein assembly factor BamE [Ketobacter sp.]|tara:strand:+ start:31 stop:543 length:513 start_codon:yes stop_codon:yes gene_type:complete